MEEDKSIINISGYTVFPSKVMCDTPLIPFVKAEKKGASYLARIVKEKDVTEAMIRHLNKETDLIHQYECDHILKRIGDPVTNGEYLALFYENCSEGSLRSYMKGKQFSLKEIREMIHQLLKALMIFNCENMCVGMITPDSIFVNKEKDQVIWKIGDLSFVKGIEEGLVEEYNSCVYLAPEIQLEKKCDSRQDVYCLGIILKAIPKKESSSLLDQLITRCTDLYHEKRMEVQDLFGHPFLHQNGKYKADFTQEKELGKGGFGSVFQAKEKASKVVYAVKSILNPDLSLTEEAFQNSIDNVQLVRLYREISSLYCFTSKKDTNHYCAKLFDHFFEKNTLYLVMEFCPDGNLSNLIPKLKGADPKIIYKYAYDIASSLVALHKLGLAHRDLKPLNILLRKTREGETTVKLCDFGLAKRAVRIMDEGTSDNVVGSIAITQAKYAPPEANKDQEFDTTFDSWSFGVVLYEMSTGQTPTDALVKTWKDRGVTAKTFAGTFNRYDARYTDLIVKCLETNFKKRIKSTEIVPILKSLVNPH